MLSDGMAVLKVRVVTKFWVRFWSLEVFRLWMHRRRETLRSACICASCWEEGRPPARQRATGNVGVCMTRTVRPSSPCKKYSHIIHDPIRAQQLLQQV